MESLICLCGHFRKYEEIYPPDVSQFAYITDNTYKVGQILRMEHLILKVLSFDMAVPTAHFFVNKFCRLLKNPEEVVHLALVSFRTACVSSLLNCFFHSYSSLP